MQKLIDFPKDTKFWYGTIIVLKNTYHTPSGLSDQRYCMVGNIGGGKFSMMDLYKSIGALIIQDLTPNVPKSIAVDKEGIKQWAIEHFELFYTKEYAEECKSKIDEIIYIDFLSDHFTQCNRNIIVS